MSKPFSRWRLGDRTTQVLLTCCSLLLLCSCGFHLRGQAGSTTLPAELETIRVRTVNTESNAVKVDMENALISQARAHVVRNEAEKAATLTLYDEKSETQVSAVGSDVRVAQLLLRYELTFDVTGASGKELMGKQSITLLRAFTFDKNNALAMNVEADEIRGRMRQDAVQQIIRRLAALKQG
jgi:LPS-assembly lipoprotein